MKDKLAQYRKALTAGVGLALLIAAQVGLVNGADVEPATDALVSLALGILTVFGVFRVPNAKAPEPPAPPAPPVVVAQPSPPPASPAP